MTINQTTEDRPQKMLVLQIMVPNFDADQVHALVAANAEEDGTEPAPSDYLYVVAEEMLREEVGLTVVSRPGDMETSDEFKVEAFNGVIVGAEVRDR